MKLATVYHLSTAPQLGTTAIDDRSITCRILENFRRPCGPPVEKHWSILKDLK